MKKFSVLAAFLAVALFVSAAEAAPRRFGVANDSTDDTVTGLMTQRLKEVLEEKSNGQFQVATFPNSQLGSDVEITQAAQNGELAFVVQNTAPQVNFVPKAAVFDLPNLFVNKEVARKALDTFQKDIEPEYEAAGLIMLGFSDQGFRVLSSNVPIEKIEDFQGLRLRTMENRYHVQYWQALGANPAPLPFSELYLSLQQGTVTGQENPYEVIVATKFYEVQKYVVDTNHLFHTITIIMSKAVYDQLTAEEQQLVREAAREVIEWGREQADLRHADRVQILQENGTEIMALSPELLEAMREKAKPVYDAISEAVGADLVGKLQAAVAAAEAGE